MITTLVFSKDNSVVYREKVDIGIAPSRSLGTYGDSKCGSAAFHVEGARETIGGAVRFKYIFDEISQKRLARELASWVYGVAPDLMDEVRKALEQSANPLARAFVPKN